MNERKPFVGFPSLSHMFLPQVSIHQGEEVVPRVPCTITTVSSNRDSPTLNGAPAPLFPSWHPTLPRNLRELTSRAHLWSRLRESPPSSSSASTSGPGKCSPEAHSKEGPSLMRVSDDRYVVSWKQTVPGGEYDSLSSQVCPPPRVTNTSLA